jgi:hypothetical protein
VESAEYTASTTILAVPTSLAEEVAGGIKNDRTFLIIDAATKKFLTARTLSTVLATLCSIVFAS